MALIPCQECKREISSEAAACPHCGYAAKPAAPPTQQPRKGISKTAGLFILIGFICLMAMFTKLPQTGQTAPTNTTSIAASPALSQERILNGKLDGSQQVIVWKDQKSLSEGMDLWRAGVAKRNPGLVVGLVSCIVPVGTSTIVTGSTIGTRTILVTSGEFTGCRGTVHTESMD